MYIIYRNKEEATSETRKDKKMKYEIRNITGQIVIATANTERAAVAAGRRHEREVSAAGLAADGFKVYDQNGKLIRHQVCNNFAENWKEAR